MLNLFNSFVVPAVEHVTLYHDDQDDHMFYMLAKYPSLAKSADGGPALSLTLYTGGGQAASNDDQGGFLTLTTELSVGEEDQAKIQDFIQNHYEGVRPVYAGAGLIRFATIHGIAGPIRLSYPFWTDGEADYWLLPLMTDSLVKSGSVKPSLIGTNAASFSAVLDQDAVAHLREALTKGGMPGGVNYSVSFLARIPSLMIHVTGSMQDIYREMKLNCRPFVVDGLQYYLCALEQIHDLETLRSTFASLQVEVHSVDWRNDASDSSMGEAVDEKLKDMAFQVVQGYLKSRFFGAAFSSGAKSDPSSGDVTASPAGASDQGSVSGGDQSWLKSFTQAELSGQLEFQATYRSNLVVTQSTSRLLSDMLPLDQVKQHTVDVNLNDPFFQILDVSVRVAADFASDPIAAITVVLDYSQQDDLTGTQKISTQEYRFTTGQEAFRFQAPLAKDQNGDPKDVYTYRSRITFKEGSTPVETRPTEARDRVLIIGYNQLGCVRVQATWGAVPTDTVKQVKIHFRYHNLNLPTAEKDVFLSPDHTTDSWFTYTGGNPSVEYEYQLSYFLTGGQRLDLPVQHGNSNTLVVNAPPEQARSTANVGA